MDRRSRLSLAAVTVCIALWSCSSPPPNAQPTCDLWTTFKDQLERGIPDVGGYVIGDDMQAAADRSGYDELPDLVNDVNVAFTFFRPGEPTPPEWTEAAGKLDSFCASHT